MRQYLSTFASTFLALSAALSLYASTSSAQTLTPLDGIVAVVEEDIILESQLERALAPIRQQLAGSEQRPPEATLRRQVLERLIMRELQVQRAQQTGIRVSDSEVDNAIVMIARQNGVSPADLRRSIEADGLNFAEFRSELRKELIVQNLHRRLVNTEVEVTDTEIDIALASAAADDDTEYDLSHILISVGQSASPQELRQGEQRVRQIIDEIRGGMSFERAAISYSDGQNALEGGRLGWRSLDEMPPNFAEQIAALEVGQISEPMRSASGFHILHVNDKRSDRVRTMTEQHARHILIRIDELTSSSAALRRAQEARQRIVDLGHSFADVAREVSEDPQTAQLGGDMEWFPRGVFGERVDEVIATLEPGDISQPFRSERGWHILEFIDERERDVTDEYRRERVRDSIRERKAEETITLWAQELRDESYVDIRIEEG